MCPGDECRIWEWIFSLEECTKVYYDFQFLFFENPVRTILNVIYELMQGGERRMGANRLNKLLLYIGIWCCFPLISWSYCCSRILEYYSRTGTKENPLSPTSESGKNFQRNWNFMENPVRELTFLMSILSILGPFEESPSHS